jgi:hypothetical protein
MQKFRKNAREKNILYFCFMNVRVVNLLGEVSLPSDLLPSIYFCIDQYIKYSDERTLISIAK